MKRHWNKKRMQKTNLQKGPDYTGLTASIAKPSEEALSDEEDALRQVDLTIWIDAGSSRYLLADCFQFKSCCTDDDCPA